MKMSRRDFFRWAGASAAVLGLTAVELQNLEKVFAAAGSPPVLWLQGSSCTGCSVSLLNAVNPTIDDVLLNKISMKYHPNLNAAAGDLAISAITGTQSSFGGQYILVVEGAIPTGANGKYCTIGSKNGVEWTMYNAVRELAPRASRVVAVGTCAAFGGVPAAGANTTGAKSVKSVLGNLVSKPVVNLPSCPAHPTVMVGTLVDLILGTNLTLDSNGRPTKYYGTKNIHENCPRHDRSGATTVGQSGCFWNFGCHGKDATTIDACPSRKWNNGVNWCINANVPCIGCSSPTFPFSNTYPLIAYAATASGSTGSGGTTSGSTTTGGGTSGGGTTSGSKTTSTGTTGRKKD